MCDLNSFTLLLELYGGVCCLWLVIYLIVFCLEPVTLLVYNFGGSTCDDELCVLNGAK